MRVDAHLELQQKLKNLGEQEPLMMGYLYSDDFATEIVDCETMKMVK
jgi:hypothetical protein